ncbi:MAG TPA: cupin domain-containing protein [Candidatus Dormibacteraeota bacterium]
MADAAQDISAHRPGDARRAEAPRRRVERPKGQAVAAPSDTPLRRKPRSTGRTGAHAVDDVVGAIGPKLRALRLQRGLSLQQLADRSEVSPAAIHKIERNGMVPTIATLMKIAAALNRPVSFLIDEGAPEGPVALTPSGTGRALYTSKSGLTLASITGPYGRFYLAGAVATIEAHASSGQHAMEHPGEELIYVLQGALEVEVDGETFRLRPGDAIHFRTDRAHKWRNPSVRPAKAVWMTQRPT